jgi:hypothetical protein
MVEKGKGIGVIDPMPLPFLYFPALLHNYFNPHPYFDIDLLSDDEINKTLYTISIELPYKESLIIIQLLMDLEDIIYLHYSIK